MLNIFVNTWGNYNENGADGGDWITLPMDKEELQEELKRIANQMGDNDPVWFINDYEWTTDCGDLWEVAEMDNIFHLNEQLQDFDVLDAWQQEEICAAVEAFGYTFTQALDKQQRGCFVYYSGFDIEQLAYHLVEECYFTDDTPEIFTRYFDYDAFARDLEFDGYTETSNGVILEG